MLRIGKYLMLATFVTVVFSSDAEAIKKRRAGYTLAHRTQLELRLGVREDTQDNDGIYYDGLLWHHENEDLVVSFAVNHWMDETTAFSLTVKSLAGNYDDEVGIPGLYSADFNVVPVFLGFKKYLGHPAARSSVRPYLALAGGPVFGTERLEILGTDLYTETEHETAVGAYFGAGIDFLAGRHFMFGINGGYNLISDFDEPVGGRDNYSSAELGVGFGLIF